MLLYQNIHTLCLELSKNFNLISEDRKKNLVRLAEFIQSEKNENRIAKLIYICIHNSRRSHFGQVAGLTAASFFNHKVETFSGGTIATKFNQNAINALNHFGYGVSQRTNTENPTIIITHGENIQSIHFSKAFDDAMNPSQNFAAIMTCSEAEENCPFIPNAKVKIATPYLDPSSSDGTGNESKVYSDKFKEILLDNLFVFSLIK